MTNSGDNGPVAPRRTLGKTVTSPEAPTQEVPRPASGDPGRRTYTVADAQTGTTLPVPPEAATRNTPSPAQAQTQGKPVSVRDKAAARAARRTAASRPRQTRRAKLRLTRVDPWSVTKVAFLLSIAFGVMCVVAVFLVFSIMSAAGVWDHVNESIQSVVSQDKSSAFDIKDYVGMSRVMGLTMLISVIDVVLLTALATLGAFIYNLSAAMLGGIEVTLAEDIK
jgi:hypothetical protein